MISEKLNKFKLPEFLIYFYYKTVSKILEAREAHIIQCITPASAVPAAMPVETLLYLWEEAREARRNFPSCVEQEF